MGMFEEQIKQELMQTLFSDTLKIYETINSKFDLDDKQKNEVISKLSQLNSELGEVLKNTKLQ